MARDAIPIADSPSGRILPWVVGAALYAALLAFAVAGATDSRLADAAREPSYFSLTWREAPDSGRALADTRLALALLKGRPGLSFADSAPLAPGIVEPWLAGDGSPPSAPAIEVAFAAGNRADPVMVAAAAAGLLPEARLEAVVTEASSVLARAPAQRLLAAFVGCGLLLVALASVAGITLLACRGHAATVDLVQVLGAGERWIARRLEAQVTRLLLRACLAATILAVASIAAARWLPGLGGLSALRSVDGIVLLTVPVLTLLAGAMAARLTALVWLRRLV